MPEKRKSRPLAGRFLLRGSFRYARSCAKNCVKVLIGRRPYFTPEDVLFRQYVREVLGIEPIRKITCISSTKEGAGSQALMTMRAMHFARQFGLTYVHTPFSEIAHADRPMREWAAAWERLFNLGAREMLCSGDGPLINFAFSFYELSELFGVRDLSRVFNVPTAEFKRKYHLNKIPRDTPDRFTVAVHARRGDAAPDNPFYYTHNETIRKTIIAVRAVLDARGQPYRVCVYSQGDKSDFVELSLPGVEFFLDADALWTMQQLIEADVLIMAKGLFSYYAAMICDGVKISGRADEDWQGWYPPPPDCDWILCQRDGSIDSAEFERQLFQVLLSRDKKSLAKTE